MKKLLLFFFLTISTISFCQKKIIQDFSLDYYAEISPTKDGQNLKVLSKKNKKVLINMEVSLNEYDFKNTKSNIVENWYGHQSIIIYRDFNFDNQKDIAIKYGNESCYGGPSYEVFLFKNNYFLRSSEFSKLAQNYCGFFDVDYKKKQINTMTKSGCCWHLYSTFTVKNNKPFLIKEIEEQLQPNGFILDNKIKDWKGKQYFNYTTETLTSDDDIKNMILFKTLLEHNKQMYLLNSGNDLLSYVFVDKNRKVEFHYDQRFFYSKKENSLSFNSGNNSYKIFSNRIEVLVNKKKTVIYANSKNRINNLSDIYATFKESNLENLEIVD